MTRLLLTILACAAVLPAAEGKAKSHKMGDVLGRQVVDAGHILEARAITGQPGVVLVRWGDLDNAIDKGGGKGSGFAWSGSASGSHVSLVKTVAFEDGSHAKKAAPETSRAKKPDAKSGKRPGDHLTSDGYDGSVSWETKTTSAWDGVVVKATSGSTLAISSGPASLSVAVP